MSDNKNNKSHDDYDNFYDDFLSKSSDNSSNNTEPDNFDVDVDFYQIDNEVKEIDKIEKELKNKKGLFNIIERINEKKAYKYTVLLFIVFTISFLIALILGEFDLIRLPWKKYPIAIQLSQNEVMLKHESNYQFASVIYPSDIDFGEVIYTSSDTSVATINAETGYVEAKKNGIATITVYLKDYKKVYDKCKIVVSDNNVMVDKINIENENIDIMNGNKYLLRYSYSPPNAGIHNFTYISSDQNVVKVNEKGEVLAVGEGQAIVTIQESSNNVNAKQQFTVYSNKDNKKISIKTSTDKVNLVVGGKQQIDYQVYPLYVPQSIVWTSLDKNIATVSNNGIITGVNYGKTEIVATAIDGTSKTIDVNISEKSIAVESINIEEKSVFLSVGDEKKIVATIKPSNATNQKIIWSSNDDQIATINESGIVKGISKGKVNITATTEDGDYTSFVVVNVNEKSVSTNVIDLTLSTSKVSLDVGSTSSVKTTITPNTATNKNLIWKSGNEKIATVSNGMIYGNAEGTTMISATTENGSITKSVMVMVNAVPLESIELNKKTVEIGAESLVQLIVTYTPTNATYKDIIWTSSNPNIATVDEKGLVKTLRKGTSVITAKASNGITKECNIIVTNDFIHVTSITLSSSEYSTKSGGKIGITPVITPSDATNPKVTISSSNSDIVKVLDDGNIEGVKEGVALITATTVDGKKTATALVTVKNRNTSIQYLNGSTIKYWYDDSYKTYAITHIWVKNAYEQFKGEMADKFGSLASPSYMTTKAAKKNPGKTLISINASSHVSSAFNRPLYTLDKSFNNTIPSPVVIYEGKVLRDYTAKYDMPQSYMRIYAMTKNGLLKYYIFSSDKEENANLIQKMLDDGVMYTFAFTPILIYNGVIRNDVTKDNNIRQSICQIDANNFLYITNISSNRSIGFSTYSLANKMIELGCKTGFNLDGGGSTSIYYVKKGDNKSTKIRVLEGSYGRSIPDILYFVGE